MLTLPKLLQRRTVAVRHHAAGCVRRVAILDALAAVPVDVLMAVRADAAILAAAVVAKLAQSSAQAHATTRVTRVAAVAGTSAGASASEHATAHAPVAADVPVRSLKQVAGGIAPALALLPAVRALGAQEHMLYSGEIFVR